MTALGGSAAYGRVSPTVSELKFGSELIHHLPGRELRGPENSSNLVLPKSYRTFWRS